LVRGFTAFFPLRYIPGRLPYGSSFSLFRAVGCVCCSELQICRNMVQRITIIIKNYQDRLRDMPHVPKTSFQRDSLGFSGDANKLSWRSYSVTTLSVYSFLRTSD